MLESEERDLTLNAVYLYFYTDSVAFPRKNDQRPEESWPFVLSSIIRREAGCEVFVFIRGLGAARISDLENVVERDRGYFTGQWPSTMSFAILNAGIVDAAPRPFSYALKPLAKAPVFGRIFSVLLTKVLHPHRSVLQSLWSYRLTSPARFRRVFARIVAQLGSEGMRVVSIDTPANPASLESRSPGLRASIADYNRIKRSLGGVQHVAMDWIEDEHYLDCGHHLSVTGHQELAQRIWREIATDMKRVGD